MIKLRSMLTALIALPICASSLAATLPPEPVQLHGAEQFTLQSVHTKKTYRVYISKPATAAPKGGFPVLYALDGDFSFPILHLNNPRAASVFQRMAQRSGIQAEPGIVVGIGYGVDYADTTDLRASDYTVPAACQPCDKLSPEHGGAEKFAQFIDEELRPAIAARLNINPKRESLLGHSYGGLFTLYHFFTRQQQAKRFAQYFAISPSIWFGERAILAELNKDHFLTPLSPEQKAHPTLLALWVGSEEEQLRLSPNRTRLQLLQKNRMVSNVVDLVDQLQGRPGIVLDHRIIADHDHGQAHVYALDRITELAFQPVWQAP